MNSDLWGMPFVGFKFLASIVPNHQSSITMRFLRLTPKEPARTAKDSPRIWIFYEILKAVSASQGRDNSTAFVMPPRSLNAFANDGDTLPTTDARGGQSVTTLTPMQFTQ